MQAPVCRACGSSEFRISQLRSSDISKLLTLRYPVRCRICKERDFIFIGAALSLPRRKRKKQDAVAEGGRA
jgi:hypothetical protein